MITSRVQTPCKALHCIIQEMETNSLTVPTAEEQLNNDEWVASANALSLTERGRSFPSSAVQFLHLPNSFRSHCSGETEHMMEEVGSPLALGNCSFTLFKTEKK